MDKGVLLDHGVVPSLLRGTFNRSTVCVRIYYSTKVKEHCMFLVLVFILEWRIRNTSLVKFKISIELALYKKHNRVIFFQKKFF